MADKSFLADRFKGFDGPTVWHEFTPLSVKLKAVNMGQGFPNWEPEEFVKKHGKDAIEDGANQYAPSAGSSVLLEEIAKRYSKVLGRHIDPSTEVTITNGVSGGLSLSIQSLISPGDEAVLIEPAFDLYMPMVEINGGVCKYVPLRKIGGRWRVDVDEFAAAFSDKTKLVVLNFPQNPIGAVLTLEETTALCEVILRYPRVAVISDEVYEHLVFDDRPHIHVAAIPGMYERTLTLSSAGKTFSITGWKIGWAVGPPALSKGVRVALQWSTFSIHSAGQVAVARCLGQAEDPYEGFPSYYAWLRDLYDRKRARVIALLAEVGLAPEPVEGTFFIFANIEKVLIPDKYLTNADGSAVSRDYAFCRFLTIEYGVTSIPPSSFFSDQNKELGEAYARFAFSKTDDNLDQAEARLRKFADEQRALAAAQTNGTRP